MLAHLVTGIFGFFVVHVILIGGVAALAARDRVTESDHVNVVF